MNWSRPPPAPIGSWETVAPEFALSKFAFHASWAACWALEPAPAMVPEAPDPPPLSLLPPQAATPPASRADAASVAHSFFDIWIALLVVVVRERAGARNPLRRVSLSAMREHLVTR